MKFKKRILTEEVGLPRSHRKTYTTNKKQKVVVSESQLQRLIGIITEQNVNTPGAPNPKDYKKGGQDPKYLADKKAFLKKYKAKKGKGTKPTTGGPTPPPAPNFNMSTWSPGFKKKVDTFLKNKNIKGAERFLKGRVDGWKKKSMKAGPKWKKQLKAKTDFAMKLMKDVKKAATKKPINESKQLITEWWLLAIQLWKVWVSWREWRNQKVAPGGGNDPREWAEFKSQYRGKLEQLKKESGKMPNSWRELESMKNEGMRDNKAKTSPFKKPLREDSWDLPTEPNDDELTMDFATSNKPPTSPKRKMCCRDRNGVMTSAANGRCPKSSTKVPCKGTPPTNSVGLTERERGSKGKFDTPKNMKACKAAGGSESLCAKHLRAGTMPPKPSGTPQGKWALGGLFCCALKMDCCEGSPIDIITHFTESNRTLKTTNSITESEIKDMKNWFNRVNKSGRGYNPSKI